MADAISTPIQSLLELFSTQFKDVKFADLDVRVLDEAAKRVSAQAEAVARGEAVLEAARAQLSEGQEALLGKAQRALAYARIYAEEDSALAERLEAIVLPRSVKRAPRDAADGVVMAAEAAPARRRGRGRPRPEDAAASPALFEKSSEGANATT